MQTPSRSITPAFEVEELDEKITVTMYGYETIYQKDEEGEFIRNEQGNKIVESRQRVPREVEIPAGWMVYFPRGHSMRVIDPKEMVRLGFMNEAALVDIDSDSEMDVHPLDAPSLKQRVQQRAASNRRRGRTAASTGSVEAEV